MKKYEILYDWLFSELNRIADSADAENFASNLTEPTLSMFVKLAEEVRGMNADLAKAKASRTHFNNWHGLRNLLIQFEQQFSTFPKAVFRKLRLSTAFADKIAAIAPPLDAVDVDENLFEIRELSGPLPTPWFSRENSQSFGDSLAVFSCSDAATTEGQIASTNSTSQFLFHLLAALNSLADIPKGHAILVKKAVPQLEIPSIEAFAKLAILSSGQPIHSTTPYTLPPNVIDLDAIRPGHPYHQWNDVLHVLSEYNSRTEILSKYLTIYHVIENFMFKRPIVKLESKQLGKVFTIRDFRRLYNEVELKESDAIRTLFNTISKIEPKPATPFDQHWKTRWATIFPPASAPDIDTALAALGLGSKHADFSTASISVKIAELVYAIRNAVVHNKETEFHLTYASLDSKFVKIIESFLIPTLEEVCFSIIGQKNSELWYSQDKLFFYK